jgi:hypothetical protein
MEKYSVELAKMIAGQPSLLTDSSAEKSQQVSQLYNAHTDQDKHYSLGIVIEKADEGKTVMRHNGGFAANNSDMLITMSDDGKISAGIFMEQTDYLAQSMMNMADEASVKMLREHYDSKLTEAERVQYANSTPREIRTFLTGQGRLPENFKRDTLDPIEATFGGSMVGFLTQNYLTPEGVIDSEELKKFQTVAEIDLAVKPCLAQGRDAAKGLLAESEKLLADSQRKAVHDLATKHKPSPNPERSYAEKMSQIKGSKFNEI